MGSDRVPMFRELPSRNFLGLIEECCHVLSDWKADSYQLSVLNERLGFKFTCEQNQSPSGPSIIAIMLAHNLIEPDNVAALTIVAELAANSNLKDILNRYTCVKNPQVPSLRTVQTPEDVYYMVAECIHSDWRNLARELSIAEYQILHIQSYTEDYQSAASEMLNLYRHSDQYNGQIQRLAAALKAIGRPNLSRKVTNSVVANPIF